MDRPPRSSHSHLLLATSCRRRLLVTVPHHVLPLNHLCDLPIPGKSHQVPHHNPCLPGVLARQHLLHRILHPSLLEFPPSGHSAWEKAVWSAGNGASLRWHLDRDPRIRLSP